MMDFTRRFFALFFALLVANFSAVADEVDEADFEAMQSQIEQMQSSIDEMKSELAKSEFSKVNKPSKVDYTPKLFGTLMALYKLNTYNGDSNFNVRNTRFGVKGNASRDVSYYVQIDFHNQGKISVLDTYVNFKRDNFYLKVGQQHLHLTTELDRGPSSNIFSTRSFATLYCTSYFGIDEDGNDYAKTLGSRDIGAYFAYEFDTKVPFSLAAGLFNGTGVNKAEWDRLLNFVGRVSVGSDEGLFGATSFYFGKTPLNQKVRIYSGELSYNCKSFFAEAIYQNRVIREGGVNQPLNLAVLQGYYNIYTPNSKLFDRISPVVRWDYGNDIGYLVLAKESAGLVLDNIRLVTANRLSAAMDFHFKVARKTTKVSFGYEKYFFNYDMPDESYNPLMHDKFTIGLVAAF